MPQEKTPVEDLDGRQLDVAVHEEVKELPGYAVDPTGVEATVSMSGEVDPRSGLRPKWSSEAEEYEEDQKTPSAPRYSSDHDEAQNLYDYMVNEDRRSVIRDRFVQHYHSQFGGSAERGHGEEFEEVPLDPETICRAALRAVRGA